MRSKLEDLKELRDLVSTDCCIFAPLGSLTWASPGGQSPCSDPNLGQPEFSSRVCSHAWPGVRQLMEHHAVDSAVDTASKPTTAAGIACRCPILHGASCSMHGAVSSDCKRANERPQLTAPAGAVAGAGRGVGPAAAGAHPAPGHAGPPRAAAHGAGAAGDARPHPRRRPVPPAALRGAASESLTASLGVTQRLPRELRV